MCMGYSRAAAAATPAQVWFVSALCLLSLLSLLSPLSPLSRPLCSPRVLSLSLSLSLALPLGLLVCIRLNKVLHTGSGDGYHHPPLLVQVNENIL